MAHLLSLSLSLSAPLYIISLSPPLYPFAHLHDARSEDRVALQPEFNQHPEEQLALHAQATVAPFPPTT